MTKLLLTLSRANGAFIRRSALCTQCPSWDLPKREICSSCDEPLSMNRQELRFSHGKLSEQAAYRERPQTECGSTDAEREWEPAKFISKRRIHEAANSNAAKDWSVPMRSA